MNDKQRSYKALVNLQNQYFESGVTRPTDFRVEMLKRLRDGILAMEADISEALYKDLYKANQEIITTEIGAVLSEIGFMLKHIKRWNRRVRTKTNFFNLPSKSYKYREPLGVTLIISPWNYPFNLAFAPVIGSIAGGNCTIIKPSEIATHTAEVIERLVDTYFEPEYLAVVKGGVEETNSLLEERFDKIFFTGSTTVGRIIMEKAAKHLTPVVLELGGKSPCIIDKTAKLDIAVKRIVYGKATNAGQTCVAPDYVLIHESIKEAFYEKFKEVVEDFFGENLKENKDFGRIINEKNHQRVISYLKDGSIIYGGSFDERKRHIDLTLLEVNHLDTPVMKEEIFGPILPVITFSKVEEIFDVVRRNPDPLALYLFTTDSKMEKMIVNGIRFGGGCINETILHLSNAYLPFGGRGTSGHGNYHGKYSFDAFTHEKSVLKASLLMDLKVKYPPYKEERIGFLKRLLYK